MSNPKYPILVTLAGAGPEGATQATGGATITDKSGTITSGGTAQTIAAANTIRRYLLIQNHSDTDAWVDFGTDAVAGQPSIKLYANGGSYEPLVISSASISIYGAVTGKEFTAKEA